MFAVLPNWPIFRTASVFGPLSDNLPEMKTVRNGPERVPEFAFQQMHVCKLHKVDAHVQSMYFAYMVIAQCVLYRDRQLQLQCMYCSQCIFRLVCPPMRRGPKITDHPCVVAPRSRITHALWPQDHGSPMRRGPKITDHPCVVAPRSRITHASWPQDHGSPMRRGPKITDHPCVVAPRSRITHAPWPQDHGLHLTVHVGLGRLDGKGKMCFA